MTSEQFKEARQSLSLSQYQLGEVLNTNPRTISWETRPDTATARSPNPVACRVMRWMLAGFRPPEFPS